VDVLSKSAGEGNPRSIIALGQMGSSAAEAVPALIRALQSEKSLVRIQAIKALEKIGPQAKSALPTLKRLAKNQNEAVREAATKATAAIEVK
jgi:HEAT repeat protein